MASLKKILCCDFCDYKTKRKAHLVGHMRTHTGEKPFVCKYCDYKAALKETLTYHMRIHTGEKPYKCDDCGYSTAFGSCFRSHRRKHTGILLYKCDECGYSTSFGSSFRQHRIKHSGELPYKCKDCGYSTLFRIGFRLHQRKHTNKLLYKCDDCEFSTPFITSFRVHQRKHTGELPYKCDDCGFSTSFASSFRRHQLKHTDELPFKCDICGYSTVVAGDFRVHQFKHTGQLPYKCSECSFRTAYKLTLDIHLNNHKGEKPYHCDFCDYKTANRKALIYHLNVHKAKSYKCEFCDYMTKQNNLFNQHLRNHIGPKKYKCNLCDAKYAHRTSLLPHKRSIHYKGKHYHCDNCEFSNNAMPRNSVHSYKCETCNQSFIYRPCLNAHLSLHTKTKLLNCNHCDFKTLHQAHLEDHLATTHLNNNLNELLKMSEGLNQAETQDGLLDNYDLFTASDDLLKKDTNMHDSQVEGADCDLTLFSNEELMNIFPLKQKLSDNLANNEVTAHVPEEKATFEESSRIKDPLDKIGKLIHCIPPEEDKYTSSVESEQTGPDPLSKKSFQIPSLQPKMLRPIKEISSDVVAYGNVEIKNDQLEKENPSSINIEKARYFVLAKEDAKEKMKSSELLETTPNLKDCFVKTIIIMKV